MVNRKDLAIHIRPGTMDADIINEIQRNEYHVTDYIRDEDFIIDVGAYIGAFALYVKQVCPNARILCLEPMPSNFATLQKNIGKEAILEPIALVAKAGPVIIYDFGSEASACHSIYDLGVDDALPTTVHGATLPQIMKKYGIDHLRFLKLDCQGAEFEILPNTPHKVLAKIDYIAMEVHRSIAKTGVILGNISDSKVKSRHLYRYLLKTHLPIHGEIESDSVQVWANRKLLPLRTQIRLNLKYVYKKLRHLYRYFCSVVSHKLWQLRESH